QESLLDSLLDNITLPPSRARSKRAKRSESKLDKSAPNPYREMQQNEYSAVARLSLSLNPSAVAEFEIFNILRSTPRAVSMPEKPPRVLSLTRISPGGYIVELCGHVSLQNEYSNGNLVLGSLPDHTFLVEFEYEKFIIDASKCGNFARNVRRSCEPNAELNVLKTGTDLHVMIAAKQEIDEFIEITIAFDKDWKKQPRPPQGCACKRGAKCRLEMYFSKINMKSNERETSGVSGKTERPRRVSIDERLEMEFGFPIRRGAAMTVSTPLAPPSSLLRSDEPMISDEDLPRMLLGNRKREGGKTEETSNNDLPKTEPSHSRQETTLLSVHEIINEDAKLLSAPRAPPAARPTAVVRAFSAAISAPIESSGQENLTREEQAKSALIGGVKKEKAEAKEAPFVRSSVPAPLVNRVSTTGGRPTIGTPAAPPKEHEKLSSGMGKRKSGPLNEVQRAILAGNTSTTIHPPPTKKLVTEVKKVGKKKTSSAPRPSLNNHTYEQSQKENEKAIVEVTPSVRVHLPKEEKALSSGDGKKNTGEADEARVVENVAEVKEEKEMIPPSSLPFVSSIPREYIRPFTEEQAWERYQKIKREKDLAIQKALLARED
ncbi:hypothetical protein PMAYCL1PPCAC_27822, partial [Pristionchus mayeri]